MPRPTETSKNLSGFHCRGARTSLALLLLAGLVTSCGDARKGPTPTAPVGAPTDPTLPAEPTGPSAGERGRIALEEVSASIRFWLANPAHDPGKLRWQELQVRGAEELRDIYLDPSQSTFLRERAVYCLAWFPQPWVEGFLVRLLTEQDTPGIVRLQAARGLVNHCDVMARADTAIIPIETLIVDKKQPATLRRQLPILLAPMVGDAAGEALGRIQAAVDAEVAALTEQAPAGDADALIEAQQLALAVKSAIQAHDLSEERRHLAEKVSVRVLASKPTFRAAKGAERLEGVYGPDHLGRWSDANLMVTVSSNFDETRTFLVDFDPYEKGLALVRPRATSSEAVRFERLRVAPGEREMTTRRLEIRGVEIATEVWVYVDGFDSPLLKEPLLIQPEQE